MFMNNIKSKINFIFFMTTKGHHGKKELYKYSLKNFNDFNQQNSFDKYLSIKVFKGDEELAQQVSKEFDYKTFAWYNPDPNINDESPYKDYGYYLLTNYLGDIVNVYSQEELLKNEYTFIYEDDSPIIINKHDFNFYLNKSIEKLEQNKDIFSVHFQRIGFLKSEKGYSKTENEDLFIDDHDYNFQNQLFRTKDIFKVVNIIKNNWNELKHIHTERAVKLAINMLNSNFKHISYNPQYAHSIHIGIPNAEEWIKEYNLKIS